MDTYEKAAKQAVHDVQEGSAVLMDVRRDDEWDYLHARDARHFDIARLERGERPDIPDDKRIYTYCQAGGRAGRAVTMLRRMDYVAVVSIGGLNDWRNAGGEIE